MIYDEDNSNTFIFRAFSIEAERSERLKLGKIRIKQSTHRKVGELYTLDEMLTKYDELTEIKNGIDAELKKIEEEKRKLDNARDYILNSLSDLLDNQDILREGIVIAVKEERAKLKAAQES